MESGQQEESPSDDRPAASSKTMESVVATLMLMFGAVVMWDSWRIGAGWGEDGPKSGYFPFYIGLIIVVGSAINLWNGLKLKGDDNPAFVLRGQLALVWSVLWPTAVFILLIGGVSKLPLIGDLLAGFLPWQNDFVKSIREGLGIYVSGTIFIAWFMRRLGQYSWIKILPVGIGVSLYFFLMFEVWFKVPLPKGPIEALFGFQ